MGHAARVRAVVFDVGETLIDESRLWAAWADWLGVPRSTFFVALGSVIGQGRDHRDVFTLLGFDYEREAAARASAGIVGGFDADDLYPDVRPCFDALRADGYAIGVVGNQPARAEGQLNQLALRVDLIATSAGWGVSKPAPEYFTRVATAMGCDPADIVHVGDRVDNDVVPAAAAGMVSVFIRRGPWAMVQRTLPGATEARLVIDSLVELPAALWALER
jgi:FMN phosphatase YigB (HAD superfamily)